MSGFPNNEMQPFEKLHIKKMMQIAPECMVLLKKNGNFPIDKTDQIALYGSGARNTLKGGTGSGDVNSRYYVTVEQGLTNAGFTITTERWLDAYDAVKKDARSQFVANIKKQAKEQHMNAVILGMGAVMPEPEYQFPLDGEGDTAIYVLSRVCGEGNDRKDQEGDYRLTKTEIRDILECNSKYKNFMLVLNVGSAVDLTPVMKVDNILILSQLGVVTGDALADLIVGKTYPSGKLSDTWTSIADYGKIGDFGEKNNTCYKEGIYIGYRYFDSVQADVSFPFGYGLSYTEFELENSKVEKNGSKITVSTTVKNIGKHAGKEVVQLYVSVPSDRLDQPYQTLVAFQKTLELMPQDNAQVNLEFDMAKIASYDTLLASYILEKGNYVLRIGNSSRNTSVCGIVSVSEMIKIRQLTNICKKQSNEDWKPENSREEIIGEIPVITCIPDDFTNLSFVKPAEISKNAMDLVKQLSDKELVSLCVGKHKKGLAGITSVIGNSSQTVAGAAGETYGDVKGIRSIIMADGPAGLRLSQMYTKANGVSKAVGGSLPDGYDDFMPSFFVKMSSKSKPSKKPVYYQYCTAIPIGTALAQSWNLEVGEICGDVVGCEMDIYGIDMWLAPAFNIHRNPLCGRNYEYYSEDPLLSGMFGAAITKGVQSHLGKSVAIKHFCCNNQETNRYQNNSVVSERALREIYLKCFEICIEEAMPKCVMTSYNLVNNVHSAESPALLKSVLRTEWGYTGLVVTDWIVGSLKDKKSEHRPTLAAPAIKAGNDLFMPGSQKDYKMILSALKGSNKEFSLMREEVEVCAAHLVELVQNSLSGKK